ncbi:dTDP-4-dehydrorhamnose reductase [Capronia epimyces CBS 606.96]|uniref:dTDP-4-dehydrorhamnose reductase n=1 Tax=Capronia epimyces CBS 606.96 TaxID=1182542 RepID=W9YGT0_9EURO|nr:dTDP-4-dehydrorhamnose reductase [Capronia epimyces CBS 606.96]EXJ92107.1 dTDP-4-dehydrorhamnose reductase [Capronia epimyces CBS 606.96]
MPSALVTGATGLLGRQVYKAFTDAGWQTTGTGFSRASGPIRKLDIQDEEAVRQLVDEVKPQVIVHCAADRQPDSCTKNPEAAHRLNVTATAHLAQLAAEHGSFLIYISTDYVFPGVAGHAPYKATDKPQPTNVYGQTKLDGEKAVLAAYPSPHSSVVLRVPVLYGPAEQNKESAVNILMDALYKSQTEKVKMDDWAIRYPTNVEDVARVCVDIAKYYTAAAAAATTKQEGLPRILHITSEDRMTKYEICKVFADIMGLPIDGVVPDKDGGKPGPDGTLRPYDTHLDTSDLKKLGIDVATVDFVAWWRRRMGAFRH